jgi:hypothetical protein
LQGRIWKLKAKLESMHRILVSSSENMRFQVSHGRQHTATSPTFPLAPPYLTFRANVWVEGRKLKLKP